MLFRSATFVVALGVLFACGPADPGPATDGGEQNDAGTDAGPTGNRAPTAGFTASESVVVGAPLVLDASASTDPDGDPLRFSWHFGDGGRGGTSQLAKLFNAPGTFSVRLTVTDPAGLTATTERTVTVTAGPAATAQVDANVRVLGADGAPVANVSVALMGGDSTATTNAEGVATLQVGTGIPQTLRLEKAGYSRQTYVTQLPASASSGQFEVHLRPLRPAITLADATAGGTLEGDSGARLTLPPSALVDETGARVTGPVDVHVTPVDVVADGRAFPGSWQGVGPSGSVAPIVSFGATDFVFVQGGQRLDLAPDRTAVIELPVFPKLDKTGQPLVAGASIPLWSLDESTGVWVMEGQGTLVASASSPSGFVQRAEVSHFSWWNCDDFSDTHTVNVDCCLDEDGNGTCDTQVACFVAGRTCATPDCIDGPEDAAPPQSGASTSVNAGAPAPLRMPTAFPVELTATGPQALSSGRIVVAPQGSGAVSSTTVVLTPAEPPEEDQLIVLPFDQTYPAGPLGQPARFQFDAVAGQKIWAAVERAVSSPLSGTLRLLDPSNAVLKTSAFNFVSGSFVQEIPTSGRYSLEVTPEAPASGGGYRLQAKVVDTALTVVSVTPAPGATEASPPASFSVTFSANLLASSATTTTVKLFGPAGEVVRMTTGGLVVTGNTLTFTPREPLGNGLPYRIRLTTGIKDSANHPLVGTFESSFRTADVVGGTGQLVPSSGARKMAMSSDGSAIVLHANGGKLTYSRYVPGEGWSMTEPVAPELTDKSYFPTIAMTAEGRALATWLGTPNGNPPYTFHTAFYAPATGWSASQTIAADPVEGIDLISPPVAALDAQGRALAMWRQGNNGPRGWFSRYLPGDGWSAPARFDNDVPYGSYGMLAMNEAGAAAFIFRSTYYQYFTAFDPVAGTFSAPVSEGGESGSRGIGIDAEGNVMTLRSTSVRRYPVAAAVEEHTVPGMATNNCPAQLAVTRGGKAYLAYCAAGPTPKAQHWPGGDLTSWDPVVDLNPASGLTRFGLTSVGEDGLVIYGMPNSGVAPAFRLHQDGVWDATDSPATAPATELADVDPVVGSEQGTALWLGPTGKVMRLK